MLEGWVPPTLYFATYEWAQKARVFVHGMLSQPSLMFCVCKRVPIHPTLFSSVLTNGPKKLECLFMAGLSILILCLKEGGDVELYIIAIL